MTCRRRGWSPRRARPRARCCRLVWSCAGWPGAWRCPWGAGRCSARRARRSPHQSRTELAGQADALGLAPGERGHVGQAQVLQPDVDQKAQAEAEFLEQRLGDRKLALAEGERAEPLQLPADGQGAEFERCSDHRRARRGTRALSRAPSHAGQGRLWRKRESSSRHMEPKSWPISRKLTTPGQPSSCPRETACPEPPGSSRQGACPGRSPTCACPTAGAPPCAGPAIAASARG
jgi:hypothetical protein